MNLSELLERQWNSYGKVHCSRLNLVIHIIAVPVFIVGTLAFFAALAKLNVVVTMMSVFSVILAFGVQGFGHSKEGITAEPFTGIKQAIVRIFLEQFITFPRFVLSGGWYVAFKLAEKA